MSWKLGRSNTIETQAVTYPMAADIELLILLKTNQHNVYFIYVLIYYVYILV